MKKPAALCLALLLLSACASDEGPKIPRSCPQVAILRDLETFLDYGRDAATPETYVAGAKMRKLSGTCEYGDEGVEAVFDVDIAAEKGPRLGGSQIGFPYFVSVINPRDEIVSKEIMTVDLAFPPGASAMQKNEPLRVYIPLVKDENAAGYRVLIGFQLTESQLNEVRKGR